MPRWLITCLSLVVFLSVWEFFGRDINPVFGSYPSAILAAFWELTRSGELPAALAQSLQPFAVGYALAIATGVPLGLGFKVKAAVVLLMSVFPICINTWAGVAAVPKSLIDVGKSFVASDAVILRRIVLPA